jgi:serine/threonine-protein kinase
VCEAATPPAPGALATVDCRQSDQPGGPAAARYSIFANKDMLAQQFNSSLQENEEILRCPGAGADSPITWHYEASPDDVAGSIACGTYQGNADIVWTQDDDLLLADVQSDNMDDLHGWWLNYS